MSRFLFVAASFILVALFGSEPARSEVVEIEIVSDASVLDGQEFGDCGAYRQMTARVSYAFDPANPHNARIVDLDRAPRDSEQRVRARGDLVVLYPEDPERGRGIALVEVCNRGGRASLSYFNLAGRRGIRQDRFGDGLLMRRGFTVIWIGWQWDVPDREDRLRLEVPIAQGDGGESVEGLVRSDWTLDQGTHVLDLAHRSHRAYPVLDPADPANRLTVRDGRMAPRRIVPRDTWRFARQQNGQVVADLTHIYSEKGFEAGKIYELVYKAEDPRVVGLGLAAVRDIIAYAKHDVECPFPVDLGIAVGISQTGRFLRHFLYQGFNTDESGRRAYDGLLIHTAGAGRGSFNHRFAQPSRDAHRYSAFFYPTDIFPFSDLVQEDPQTGQTGGILERHLEDGNAPKIFYTNTGYEYWGRAASLLHTTIDGESDVELGEQTRLYHLASTQHFPVGFPPRAGLGNPADLLVSERALLVALQEWVEDEIDPPPSAYPRRANDTLVSIDKLAFPSFPGGVVPSVVHEAYRADYGATFENGVVTRQPPLLGVAFESLVAQVDKFGNELAGLACVETLVPLATYAPWHLRKGFAGGNGELTDFYGSFFPLSIGEAERKKLGDSRPSIGSLYESREAYLEQVNEAAQSLVTNRTLLPEDVARVRARAAQTWDWIHETGGSQAP